MKKVYLTISLLLAAILLWFLFLKPYDYLVSFNAASFPGTVNQSIKSWSKVLESSTIEKSDDVLHLKQTVKFNDSIFIYDWKIASLTDSTSQVKVYISHKNHSLHTRIMNAFSKTDFERRVKNSLTIFNQRLIKHIDKFKVNIVGESTIEESYCAYIRISEAQADKATGMMKNFGLLTSILQQHDIKLNAKPFLTINTWDMKNDQIIYDFCYPVDPGSSIANHPTVSFKKVPRQKALKAIYNGNYITSDRAWYALLDYAKQNEIRVEKTPIEVFHNNPNMGGDELQWMAEIFLPIKE